MRRGLVSSSLQPAATGGETRLSPSVLVAAFFGHVIVIFRGFGRVLGSALQPLDGLGACGPLAAVLGPGTRDSLKGVGIGVIFRRAFDGARLAPGSCWHARM